MSRRTLAAATAVLIFVVLLFAYALDVTNNEEGDADVVGWLIVSAVASLIAALLLLRFVPASEAEPSSDNKPARRALILGVLSLITVAVFWTGLPFALGVPALALAATGQARAPQEGHGGQATAAAVLAAFAIVVSIVFCVTG
jgi:RsiW-degrading membrane proteinase PrsW (M82 family)